MEKKNYKIIENREELSDKEILAGLSFSAVTTGASMAKKSSFNLFTGIAVSILVITCSVFLYFSNKSSSPEKQLSPIDTSAIPVAKNPEEQKQIIEIQPAVSSVEKKQHTDTLLPQKINPTTITEEDEKETETNTDQLSVPFKTRTYADAAYAMEIKDSVYGPVNVSQGYGDIREFKDNTSKFSLEENSAWFKFTIKRDTLLTLHIVPKLKTDNFDFVLYKCTPGSNCEKDIRQNKLKPVRSSFSWNTSHNCNTGLSSKARDTLFEAVNFKGIGQGRTYEPALKAKAGDTFYLMVTTNLSLNQEPDGFMIYFYNTLPKRKQNKYN